MNITLVYYLLAARYGNSVIASSDENRFSYQLFSIMFQYGPTWAKELSIQKELRDLSIEEFQRGSTSIANHAENPSTQPSDDILNFINSQNVSKVLRSKADGYALLISLLKDDVTEKFISKFSKLFLTVVEPEAPLWYKTYPNDPSYSDAATDMGNIYDGVNPFGNFRNRYFTQIFPSHEEFEEEWNSTIFAQNV